MKALPTKRLPASERRQIILNAALTVLSRKGFSGMTTLEVARQAGITEPILYRHFSSKRAMLRALLDQVIEQMMDSFRKLSEGEPDPVAALHRICRAYPKMAEHYRREFRVINQMLAECSDPKIREALTGHYDAYRAFLQNLIEKGQQTGALRRDIPADVGAWHMIHAALGFLLAAEVRGNVRSAKDLEGFADATLGGLLETK
jgi:AcrR family transcriptional regulator